MIQYQFFPRSMGVTEEVRLVIDVFKAVEDTIDSNTKNLNSDEVLSAVRSGLKDIGYNVEEGKKEDAKIGIPVLFGYNNDVDKFFNADALSNDGKIGIEVEAG